MLDETTPAPFPDAAQALRELSGMVLDDHSFHGVLERASQVAKRVIPGADEVSVTMKDSRPMTVAASGALASEVDESQYEVDSGPCLEAVFSGQVVLVNDMATETRWPRYLPRAAAAGVRSSLSLPMPVDGTHVGAFNAYSRSPRAFNEHAVEIGQELAAYTSIVLGNAGLYFTAATRADQLVEAMRSRAVIEQAKGILMGARRCSAEEAFDLLVRLSQQTHRKLRDVARVVVEDATAQAE